MENRWDETWHRLREWTNGQGASERLAAQVLLFEGFTGLDPSHPLGGRDGGKDAICSKNGQRWIMAAHFPRGQQPFAKTKKKLLEDAAGAKANGAGGIAFVTNQELALSERSKLEATVSPLSAELYHLERLTALLDSQPFASIRKQYLGVDYGGDIIVDRLAELKDDVLDPLRRLESLQTGGDTFCYWMLYNFDLSQSIARDFVIIRQGEFPLYDLRVRITDLNNLHSLFEKPWGELNSSANFLHVKWPLPDDAYYRIFFGARNGQWHQDLILRRSDRAQCWLAATRVLDRTGRDTLFKHFDNEYELEFGSPEWRG